LSKACEIFIEIAFWLHSIKTSETLFLTAKILNVMTGDGTITNDMIGNYCKLHELGVAKSIEVWQDDGVVGGFV
jgi:hypothetical protein